MAQSPASPEQSSFLGGCLVESDSEFERRARKIKRRALIASIILQVLVVAALVLFPLLSKGEGIATFNATPVPPYHRGTATDHRQHNSRPIDHRRAVCITCFRSFQPIVASHDPVPTSEPIQNIEDDPPGSPEGQNIPGLPSNALDRRLPPPPPPTRPRTLQVSAGVQAARLIHRVEPVYPFLPKSLHREGRVELRAMIATDGRIKSLEVVSGDTMFIQSALSAVQEWRYQPTLLNGEPVEVDTYITVIYTLSH
jgi:TonB family protein